MTGAVVETPVQADVERIAREIESYLSAHPDAADTAEGITTWWVSLVDRAATLPQVEAALHILVQQGRVRRQMLPDGNCLYSL